MPLRKAFAKVLREVRQEQRLTQEQLAVKSGVSMQIISYLECARFQPSLVTLFALSKALRVSVSDLVEVVERQS